MAATAQDVLAEAVRRLAPGTGANRLVPLIAEGRAPLDSIAALALEQHHIIPADRTGYRLLRDRCAQRPAEAAYFAALAAGEDLALQRLPALLAACGQDETAIAAYEPKAGCQAYPAYTAWLALNAEPVDVVVAVTANFAAFSGYCATVAHALRTHYGFSGQDCGFFDLFAAPDPEGERRAVAAVNAGLEAGRYTPVLAHRHGRLLQAYELMFWNTLAP
ncbi:transcriptional regulator [Streptomyces orinoci]|uniref:Transcriptional regulator n=1 Tax=Streptomyces orinoci TaxID=67339 RepID=A0ABV3K3A3_STRON|nr:transcriptional regulator [Streptomyces orinoci]